jgi:tetratricopeptide (TPR) repeat protein
MFKSHIRTFERSFWSAGRDAKKGRGDLREYLELHPDDPIANGIMGTFLYFADTLPAAFKFISKLLFMPTGDREEGLRRMVKSCEHHSLIEVDNKTLLFSVYIAFEGRYEDGLDGFLRLHRRYPDYPSFVRPFALTLPFTPRDRDEVMAMLEPMLDRDRNRTRFRQDPGPYAMLQFTRAYADRFYDPHRARREFEAIIADDPAHPDWVPSYSAFALARQLAAAGDYDGARKRLRAVLDDRSGAYLHGEARSLLDALDDAGEPRHTDVGEIDVAAIYGGDRQAIERVAEQLRGAEMTATDPGVQTGFYLAEALFMLGDEDGALEMFRAVLERDAPLWDESFQLIACSRLAEIHGSRLQYEQAARYLDRAPEYYHKEFLYDWLFEGRKRFYERIAGGEFHATPTLFSNVP